MSVHTTGASMPVHAQADAHTMSVMQTIFKTQSTQALSKKNPFRRCTVFAISKRGAKGQS